MWYRRPADDCGEAAGKQCSLSQHTLVTRHLPYLVLGASRASHASGRSVGLEAERGHGIHLLPTLLGSLHQYIHLTICIPPISAIDRYLIRQQYLSSSVGNDATSQGARGSFAANSQIITSYLSQCYNDSIGQGNNVKKARRRVGR